MASVRMRRPAGNPPPEPWDDAEPEDNSGLLPPATTPPFDADPPERRRAATPIADVVQTILRRLIPPEVAWLQQIADSWADWVGPTVAACSRPGRLADGTLYVYVRTSGHLAELRRHHLQSLEARVRQRAGHTRVRGVRLMLDPRDETPPPGRHGSTG